MKIISTLLLLTTTTISAAGLTSINCIAKTEEEGGHNCLQYLRQERCKEIIKDCMLENPNDVGKAVECSNEFNCTRENNAPYSYVDKFSEFSCIFGCMKDALSYENLVFEMKQIFGGMDVSGSGNVIEGYDDDYY